MDSQDLIPALAQRYGVPPEELASLAHGESAGNPEALGPVIPKGMLAGDRGHGLFQMTSSTARSLGRDPATLDAAGWADAGADYYARNRARFGGDAALAAAAHHAGPEAVARAGGVPNTTDSATGLRTSDYVKKFSSRLQGGDTGGSDFVPAPDTYQPGEQPEAGRTRGFPAFQAAPDTGPEASGAPAPEESATGAFTRHFGEAYGSAGIMGRQFVALAADGLARGGIAPDSMSQLRDYELGKAKEGEQAQAAKAQDYDQLTNVLKDPTFGNFAKWGAGALGDAAGFISQQLAASAIGGAVMTAAAPGAGTVAGAVGGVAARSLLERALASYTAKMSARIAATEAGAKLSAEELQKAAIRAAFQSAGGIAAGTAMNVGMGMGATYGAATQNGEKELSDPEYLKAASFGAGSGVIGEMLALAGIKPNGAVPGMGMLAGRSAATRALGGAALTGATTGAEMAGMGALQDIGSGQDITLNNTINRAAGGLVMGAIPGALHGYHQLKVDAVSAIDQAPDADQAIASAMLAARAGDAELDTHARHLAAAQDLLNAPEPTPPLQLGYEPAAREGIPTANPEANERLWAAHNAGQFAAGEPNERLADAAVQGLQGAPSDLHPDAENILRTTYGKAIEERGGVALPHEAAFFQERGEKPYDSVAAETAPGVAGTVPVERTGARTPEQEAALAPNRPLPEVNQQGMPLTGGEGGSATQQKPKGPPAPKPPEQQEIWPRQGALFSRATRTPGELYDGPENTQVKAMSIDQLPVRAPGRPVDGVSRGDAAVVQQALRSLGHKVQMFEGNTAFYDPRDPNTIHIGNQMREPLGATVFHEVFHAIETHAPDIARAFRDEVAAHLTPDQAEKFKAEYGPIEGEAAPDGKLGPTHIREISADTFGAIANGDKFFHGLFTRMAAMGMDRPSLYARVGAIIDRVLRTMRRGLAALKPGDRFATGSDLAKIDRLQSAATDAMARYAKERQLPAREMEHERLKAAHETARLPLSTREAPPPRNDTAFEVAPKPADSAAWDKLHHADKTAISEKVISSIVPKVLRQWLTPGRVERQIGGWEGKQNPSYVLKLANPARAPEIAKVLGHVLGQKSMMLVTDTAHEGSNPMAELRIKMPRAMGYDDVQRLYSKLEQLKDDEGNPLIQGHSTQGAEMRTLHPSADDGLREKVQQHLGNNYEVEDHPVHASFMEEGKDYGEGTGPTERGSQGKRTADLLRDEAAEMVSREVAARRPGGEDGGAEGRPERADRGRAERAEPGKAVREHAQGVAHENEAEVAASRPGEREPRANESRAGHAGEDRQERDREHPVVSAVGTHYSQLPRTSLRSDKYGTGLPGAERNRLTWPSADPRIRHRVYFYVNTGKGVSPEGGVGGHAHEAQLGNLYDIAKNPLELKHGGDMNSLEAQILNHGYDGYVAPFGNQKAAVLLGKRDVPVKYVGTGKREGRNDISESRAGPVDRAREALGPNARLLDDAKAYDPENKGDDGRTRLDRATGKMTVELRRELLDGQSERAQHVALHESGHAADMMGTVYSRHPDLAGVVRELGYLRTLDSAARKELRYPFDMQFSDLLKDPPRLAAEIFAQGWAMHHTPYFHDLMERETPYAHQFFKDAADHAAVHAGDNRVSAEESAARRASFDGDRSLSKAAEREGLHPAAAGRGAGAAEGAEARGDELPSREEVNGATAAHPGVDRSNPGNEPAESRAKRGPEALAPEEYRKYAELTKHLSPREQDELTHKTAANLIKQMESWPSSEEHLAAAAFAGRAKRGWYADTVHALGSVFGVDAPRFAALLAATSPQTDVHRNFGIATRLWASWVKAGRPQDEAAIIRLGRNAARAAGAGFIPAYARNAFDALTHPDPVAHALSGPKVDSFMRNLLGHVNEVTNDTWMANFHGVAAEIFGGKGILEDGRTRAGKDAGYLAASIMTRRAAGILSERTGVPWSPAEVQETVWAWAKTLAELGDRAGNTNKSLAELLEHPEFTHDLINATPDFRTLFNNPSLDKVLRKSGYGDQLDALRSGGHNEPAAEGAERQPAGEKAPFDRGNQERLDRENAERLQQTRTPDRVIGNPDTGTPDFFESRAGQIRQEWDHHSDLTQDQRDTLAKVGAIVPKENLKSWWGAKTANWKERTVAGVLDDLAPLMKLDPTKRTSLAYQLGKLSRGYAGTIEAMLRYGKVYLDNGAPNVNANDTEGGYAKLLGSLYSNGQSEVQRALWWIAGQRAEGLKQLGLENLMGGQDIANLKGLASGKMSDGRDRGDVYQKFLDEHTKFNNAAIDVTEQSGLITPDVAQMMRDHPYVPFYRVMENANNGVLGPVSKSGLTDQRAWKKLKGGTEAINSDLLENVLGNWAHLFQASAKNRAALETVDTLIKHHIDAIEPVDPGMTAPRDAITVMRDGIREQYQIHDPLVTQAVAGITHVTPEYLKAFGFTKRMLTAGITASPFFRVRIAVREALASLVQSEIGTNPMRNVIDGWKHTDMKSQVFASTLASGGQIRFGQSERSIGALAQVGKLVDAPPAPGLVPWLGKHISNVWDAYHELGNRTENFNRTALYDQLRNKTNPDTGVKYTHAEASFAARDLLDFSASGAWPLVKFLEQSVPFFNARKQGLYSIGKTAANDPHGLMSMKNRVTAVTMTAGVASLALMLGQQDEDWWKNRTDYDRDAYWAFKLGSTIFRIPKPFELGAAATEFERTWELAAKKDMTLNKYAGNIRQVVLNSLALDPTPQLVKPLWALYANRDPQTQRPIETAAEQARLPADRYDESTSGIARALGSIGIPDPVSLAQATYKPVDPKQVDYLLKSYFGAAGVGAAGFLDFLGSGLRKDETPALTLRSMTGSMVSTEDEEAASRYVQDMHDHLDRIHEAVASVKEAMAEGNTAKVQELRQEYADELRAKPLGDAASKRIAAVNQQLRRVEASTLLKGSEKRAMINSLQRQKGQIAQQFEAAAAP